MKILKDKKIIYVCILLLMFFSAMNKYMCYVLFPIIIALALLFAKSSNKEKNNETPFLIVFLLAIQNLIIGIGAHLFTNIDFSLKLLTQVPFMLIFFTWMFLFLDKKNRDVTYKYFYIFIAMIAISFFIGRGNIQSICINIRNLTLFYMVFQIGNKYLYSKNEINKFIEKIFKLSGIILFIGIILYIGGFELYKMIGIVEVYYAKLGGIIKEMDNRFYTTLITTRVMRMGSIFYEPVNLAYFYSCTFLLSLFHKNNNQKKNVLINGLGLLLTFGKGGYLIAILGVLFVLSSKFLYKFKLVNNITKSSNVSILIIILGAVSFSIYYYLNIGAAATTHFVGVIKTFESVRKQIFGYGLGTGGNMAILFGSNNDWLSSGGETAFMSFFYQIGIQGVIALVILMTKLMVTKINENDKMLDMQLLFRIMPIIIILISILQENTFTPQCITLFMLMQGAMKINTDGLLDAKNKKIAFLITNFSNNGGTERVTSIIANKLEENNWDCSIISCNDGINPKFDINKKINLISLNGEKDKNPIIRKINNIKKLEKLYMENQYDIIIAVDIALFLYLLPLKKHKEVKLLAWEHFNCYTVQNSFSKISRKLACKYADCIIVLGKNDLENYKNRYKNINRIEYIYNPLAIDITNSSNLKNNNVIAVGRLEDQKGFDYLIKAWEQVEKKHPNWNLNIYGNGSKKDELLKLIEDKELKTVKINNFVNNIKEKYQESSIFVLSSRYEGFGLVLLEAQACGLPCISFNCKEGPAEIIDDGINGYLVECYDYMQLANRINELIENPKKLKEFAKQAKKDLYRFDPETVYNNWENLLNNIMKG